MRVEQLELSEWESALPSDGFEVFHRPEALEVVDRHTDAEMKLFGGFKGQQPIALLPAFVQRKSVGTAVTSPPPGLGIPRLGPIVMPTSPKRRKQEKVNQEFTETVLAQVGTDLGLDERLARAGVESPMAESVLDRLDVDSRLTLFRMVCSPDYADPRPYAWGNLHVEPNFTYHLDLNGRDTGQVRKSFSKSLRREIRDAEDLDVTVETEGVEGARDVFRATERRYAEQDEPFSQTWSYVRDLFDALGERARSYVARDADGEYLSGITVLYSDDAAYFWQGGAKAIYEGTAVNSRIHWRIIEDIVEDPPVESVDTYDLMGANTERLCRYKAKFGADLVPYYVVESSGPAMDVAKRAYQLVR
ncbi:GNAT family N-acetyltransferase [Halorussus salilacus]|uniref:GNAT family N-acetyltransferase n=1 Tax=Halorussus salilacus TaxID=2953750 RepID=UPI00209E6A85|nr:GNAT family N-acetyltransferase [Halorussus salilacus]USZ68101.1 GNAT family N-acetyltransferase [Halorussus salilacus]